MPEKSYTVVQDGNQWCCYDTNDFIDLQESEVVFEDTPLKALKLFIETYE